MADFEAEIACLDEHWQGRTIAVMLRHAQAGDIGAPSAENVFDRTQNNQALHVDTASGGGRSSVISRRMSANRFRGMAASAIWKAT
jgi:hypothetical protein